MLLQLARTTEPRGFRLVGEMDISNVSALADALQEDLDAGGDITLDLAGLAFLDSTGIQVIIQSAQRLGDRGRLRLLQPGVLVRRTLERVRVRQLANVDLIDDE
jgi:anti-anti-sigma factor